MFTDFITNMINSLSELLYSHILIILLLGAGIFFTIKTKFVQIRMFIESLRVVAQPGSDKNGLSSFQALMVSTASRVGTGNIAGISTAICLGGSGAVFWMWLTAILGSASAFIESTLAQIYKHKAKDGSSYGGPAYYIQAALKKRWIGVLFAVVLILTYMGGFNLVASIRNGLRSLSERSLRLYLLWLYSEEVKRSHRLRKCLFRLWVSFTLQFLYSSS